MTRASPSSWKSADPLAGGGTGCRLKKADVLRDVFPAQISVERLQLDQACAVCQGDFSEDVSENRTWESSLSRRASSPEASCSDGSSSSLFSDDLSSGSGAAETSSSSDLGSSTELAPLGLISGCVHSFHHVCIQNWGFQQNTCPQCKRRFSWLACYSREGCRMKVTYVRNRNLKVDGPVVSAFSDGAVCPVCLDTIENGGGVISCDGCSAFHHLACAGAPVNRSELLNGLWFCQKCVCEEMCVDREGQPISASRLTFWGFYETGRRRRLRRASAASRFPASQNSNHQVSSRARRLAGRLVRSSSHAHSATSRSNHDTLDEVLDRSLREAQEAWQQYHSGAGAAARESLPGSAGTAADEFLEEAQGVSANSISCRRECDGALHVSSAYPLDEEQSSADGAVLAASRATLQADVCGPPSASDSPTASEQGQIPDHLSNSARCHQSEPVCVRLVLSPAASADITSEEAALSIVDPRVVTDAGVEPDALPEENTVSVETRDQSCTVSMTRRIPVSTQLLSNGRFRPRRQQVREPSSVLMRLRREMQQKPTPGLSPHRLGLSSLARGRVSASAANSFKSRSDPPRAGPPPVRPSSYPLRPREVRSSYMNDEGAGDAESTGRRRVVHRDRGRQGFSGGLPRVFEAGCPAIARRVYPSETNSLRITAKVEGDSEFGAYAVEERDRRRKWGFETRVVAHAHDDDGQASQAQPGFTEGVPVHKRRNTSDRGTPKSGTFCACSMMPRSGIQARGGRHADNVWGSSEAMQKQRDPHSSQQPAGRVENE